MEPEKVSPSASKASPTNAATSSSKASPSNAGSSSSKAPPSNAESSSSKAPPSNAESSSSKAPPSNTESSSSKTAPTNAGSSSLKASPTNAGSSSSKASPTNAGSSSSKASLTNAGSSSSKASPTNVGSSSSKGCPSKAGSSSLKGSPLNPLKVASSSSKGSPLNPLRVASSSSKGSPLNPLRFASSSSKGSPLNPLRVASSSSKGSPLKLASSSSKGSPLKLASSTVMKAASSSTKVASSSTKVASSSTKVASSSTTKVASSSTEGSSSKVASSSTKGSSSKVASSSTKGSSSKIESSSTKDSSSQVESSSTKGSSSKVESSSKASSSRAGAAPSASKPTHPSPLGSVEFTTGINGLEKVVLRGPRHSSAEVYLYGAQVMSWKNRSGEELLFVSSKATFTPPKPIRGGIPICFPQFWNAGNYERHGFVRTRFWRIDNEPPPLPTAAPVSSSIDLILDEEDRWIWPQKYEFRQRIALGYQGELRLTARIRNIRLDRKPFTFTFAYHPYLFVSDIEEVRVEGVETLYYFDHLRNKERFTEQADCITFESEVDKVYLCTPTKIAILDHQRRKTIELRKDGLFDAIVWNPWDKKAKTIADLGDKDYRRMLCVGAAQIETPITLKPGQEWKGRMELTFVPSSYFSGELDPEEALRAGY